MTCDNPCDRPSAPGLHQPQDDHALTFVDDRVDDQPGAAAVGGGPLVGALVVAIAGLARVLQQLLDPRADLLAGVLGQAGVGGVGDLQPDNATTTATGTSSTSAPARAVAW